MINPKLAWSIIRIEVLFYQNTYQMYWTFYSTLCSKFILIGGSGVATFIPFTKSRSYSSRLLMRTCSLRMQLHIVSYCYRQPFKLNPNMITRWLCVCFHWRFSWWRDSTVVRRPCLDRWVQRRCWWWYWGSFWLVWIRPSILDIGVVGLAHGVELQMMFGFVFASQIFFDVLPEFVVRIFHELSRDISLVLLPVVLSHCNADEL